MHRRAGRRERTQRDVALALLLDMSATTNEYVQLEAARAVRPTAATAQSYSRYLRQIASGVDERGKPFEHEARLKELLGQQLTSVGEIQPFEYQDPGYVPSCTLRT